MTYWLHDLLATESEIEHAAMTAETWVESEILSAALGGAAAGSVNRQTRIRHLLQLFGINKKKFTFGAPPLASHPVSHPSRAVSIDSNGTALDLAAAVNARRMLAAAQRLYADLADNAERWSRTDIENLARLAEIGIASDLDALGAMTDQLSVAFADKNERLDPDADQQPGDQPPRVRPAG
ncbi:MAG: hypothetical protein AAGF47_02320 [Planctomycetota bacterium]